MLHAEMLPVSVASLDFFNLRLLTFDSLLSLRKSEMNLIVASFFEMMNVGMVHSQLLICFNTPNLISLSKFNF